MLYQMTPRQNLTITNNDTSNADYTYRLTHVVRCCSEHRTPAAYLAPNRLFEPITVHFDLSVALSHAFVG